MAPLQPKNPNIMTNTSPNTSRKRKSDDVSAPEPIDATNTTNKAPATKRARKTAPPPQVPAEPKAAAPPTPEPKTKPPAKKAPSRSTAPNDDKYDITTITLEGEPTASVPIYDTVSDIRTKINTHFRTAPTPYSSQASLIRALKAQYPPAYAPESGISAPALKTFMSRKGHCGGASSPIFYAAYVYFEKLRIKQGKKKTKKRVEMEESWGKEGFDTRGDSATPRWMMKGEGIAVDKYGHMEKVGVNGRVVVGWGTGSRL